MRFCGCLASLQTRREICSLWSAARRHLRRSCARSATVHPSTVVIPRGVRAQSTETCMMQTSPAEPRRLPRSTSRSKADSNEAIEAMSSAVCACASGPSKTGSSLGSMATATMSSAIDSRRAA